jgi:hypothetical protein
MGRRDWFQKNPYSPGMRKSQDQELLLRVYRRSRFESLNQILLGYRKDRLSLKDILKSRLYFLRALLMRALRDHNAVLALGVPENVMKAPVEILAISTGLNYNILRRRALPVALGEIQRWKGVWAACAES